MNSKTSKRFWNEFDRLPPNIQRSARDKFQLWQNDPFHPSLHFKELMKDLWSVRITHSYRALTRRRDNLLVWFWIGTHEDYEALIQGR